MSKKLIYYISRKRTVRYLANVPLHEYVFRDVKTGNLISLEEGINPEEVINVHDRKCYGHITEACEDYDILWRFAEDKIKPVDVPFELVQEEYLKYLSSGEPIQDINEYMVNTYCNRVKTI